MIASPKVETKEGEKPHACNGVKNSSQMFDRLCLHRIAQEWKACSRCEHKKRLDKLFNKEKGVNDETY